MKDIALSFDGVESLYYEPYSIRGILHSEMALVLGFCQKLDIEVVIESGRARAQSTYILCKYLPNTPIYSIEMRKPSEYKKSRGYDIGLGIERVKHFDNLTLISEGASTAIPAALKKMEGKRIALLIDGPKGSMALAHMKCALPKIEVGFAHDFRKIQHDGVLLNCRLKAEEKFPTAWFTDDPEYVTATSWLDQECWSTHDKPKGWTRKPKYWAPYHQKGHFTDSYGPTLAVFT